jgi:Tfp pilus assembly protein PilO
MDATFHKLSKIAALRSQAESYFLATLGEIRKDKPDLDRAFDMGDKALAALETLRIEQASMDRRVVAMLGQLHEAVTTGGRA